MPAIKYVYMPNFMLVGVSVIEILEFNRAEEHGKTVKYHIITSITPVLQDFTDFFSILLVFNVIFTLVLVEVKLNGI